MATLDYPSEVGLGIPATIRSLSSPPRKLQTAEATRQLNLGLSRSPRGLCTLVINGNIRLSQERERGIFEN